MGLFDGIKKAFGNKENNSYNEQVKPRSRNDIRYSQTNEGEIIVEFNNNDSSENFKNMYDTTKLKMFYGYRDTANNQLVNAQVAWYNESDAIYINNKTGQEYGSRVDYIDIEIDINYEKLTTDQKYVETLLAGILQKNRVETKLQEGLQENPKIPCGKYVGGVVQNEKGEYKKVFDQAKGRNSHNSLEMQQKRRNFENNRQEDLRKQLEQEQLKQEQSNQRIAELKAKMNDNGMAR